MGPICLQGLARRPKISKVGPLHIKKYVSVLRLADVTHSITCVTDIQGEGSKEQLWITVKSFIQ